jgi:hypothetical protein
MRCNRASVLLWLGLVLLPISARSGENPAIKLDKAWPTVVNARYSLRYNGFEVGQLKVKSNITTKSYSLSSSGKVSALFGAFSWSGSSSVSGTIERGTPAPVAYSFDWRGKKKRGTIEIGFKDRVAKEITLKPRPRIKPDTVPLKPIHRAGALDPMSALLMLTNADGRPPCDRRIGIFDGKQRYDIILAPKRLARLRSSSAGGRSETAYVCRITYAPVAGHRDNADTKTYASNRSAELVLRRIPGSKMLIPYSVTIPTAWGTGSMVAERIDIVTATAGKFALIN